MHYLLYQCESVTLTPTARVREEGHKKSKCFVADVSCGMFVQPCRCLAGVLYLPAHVKLDVNTGEMDVRY